MQGDRLLWKNNLNELCLKLLKETRTVFNDLVIRANIPELARTFFFFHCLPSVKSLIL